MEYSVVTYARVRKFPTARIASLHEKAFQDYHTYIGSSSWRVGDFGLISYRVEHAGEDFQAQELLIA